MVDLRAVVFTMGVAFILSVIIGPLLIPILRRLKFGQQIRADGPATHRKKSGTPTMGGVIILLALSLAFFNVGEKNGEFYILVISALGFGLVGFLDDYIKIAFKRSLGLTAKQKLAGQLLVSAAVCWQLIRIGHSTDLTVPGLDGSISLGWLYYPFVVIMMLAISNAVNFTDGLDGLLSGNSAIALGAFAIIAMYHSEQQSAMFAAAMIGGVLGFLVYNAHPAKVFMGDTGSLGIGGGLAAVAILTKTELLFIVIGGIFVIELLSVIIQVASFKTRGKRVFKMSPIHHHFELVGWSEWRIVVTFWLVGILFAGIGIYMNEVL